MSFNLLPNHEKLRLTMAPHVACYHLETRSGPTGQGHTFESIVLDKTEDNLAEADIYDTEIKTCSAKSVSARVRLATMSFSHDGDESFVGNIVSRFGTTSVSRTTGEIKQCFQRSIRCEKPALWKGTVVNLRLDSDALRLDAGAVQGYVPRSTIDEILSTKLKNLAVIKTKWKKVEDKRAYNYHGFHYFDTVDTNAFWQAVGDGKLAFEFRIRGAKDHGVSMNLNLNRITGLYRETTEWDSRSATV